MKYHRFIFVALLVFLFGIFAVCQEPEIRPDKIWDAAAILKEPPKFKLGYKAGLVQEIYYDGEPFNGNPTRVFGYLGVPEGEGPFNGKFPAILLIHGGGGKAFANWAEHWAARGYYAIAMDLAGKGPEGPLPDGGPNQDDNGKFRDFTVQDGDYKNMWTYHSISAILRAHSILASYNRIEPSKIAATGISWGGYLTCILSGVDDKLCCAVPVYGCGFLHENSAWVPRFNIMPAENKERWISLFDPSKHINRATCPLLFATGTNDFAYPLDSLEKTYKSPKGEVMLSITIRRPHSHIFSFKEVDTFIDSHIFAGTDKAVKPLAKISPVTLSDDGKTASVSFKPEVPIIKAELSYTTADGVWKDREWKTIPAKIDGDAVSADLPLNPSPSCYYFLLTDERNLPVSSPLVIVR